MHISSYNKVFDITHNQVADILDGPVSIEEKVDGSQFSFGVRNGEIFCRSKGKPIVLDAPDKMFINAINSVKSISNILRDGFIYRAEYLLKPKHHTMEYDRIPTKHLLIYDIDTNNQNYLQYDDKLEECKRIGLECAPLYYEGIVHSLDSVKHYLDRDSILGGPVEGIVIKNYSKYGADKKILMAKIVKDEFKEKHKVEWKKQNPSGKDILMALGDSYRSEARWEKSIQYLKEMDMLTNSDKDIGMLLNRICDDIKEECEDEIKDALFKWAWPHIERRSVRGFPEWYKSKLDTD